MALSPRRESRSDPNLPAPSTTTSTQSSSLVVESVARGFFFLVVIKNCSRNLSVLSW